MKVREIKDEEEYEVTFDYNKGFVEWLKEAVPAMDRDWVPESKSWIITEESIDKVILQYQHNIGEVKYYDWKGDLLWMR
jgi:hypothetical protein